MKVLIPLAALAALLLSTASPARESVAATNADVRAAWELFAGTNGPAKTNAAPVVIEDFKVRLEIARHERLAHEFPEAMATYVAILESKAPESVQRTALFEMAQTAEDQNDLARAQQILAQCLTRWPKDVGVPEVLLRQGLLYRKMGLDNLAMSKFYSVMTSALVLKPERFDYYQQLVLRAQNEIADTQFQLGSFREAAASYSRLLQADVPPPNVSTIQTRLIHCLSSLGKHGDVIARSQEFLTRFPDAQERPEVHFLCATAMKQVGRSAEALQQVLALLQEPQTGKDPQTLAYWQRRAGNELANRFYQEGDSMKALDIYLALAPLDSSPEWQFPVWYQIGLVFERMNQPTKAIEYYSNITDHEKEAAPIASPGLKALMDMAKWRKDFIAWQSKAEDANHHFQSAILGTNVPPVPPPMLLSAATNTAPGLVIPAPKPPVRPPGASPP